MAVNAYNEHAAVADDDEDYDDAAADDADDDGAVVGGGVGGGGCGGGGGGHDAHGSFFCHDLCSHALWKAYTLAFSDAPGNPELESHNQLES